MPEPSEMAGGVKPGTKGVWEILRVVVTVGAGLLMMVSALVGFPLAFLAASLFPGLVAVSRPGKLGMEDKLGHSYRLAAVCGLLTALLFGAFTLLHRFAWARPS